MVVMPGCCFAAFIHFIICNPVKKKNYGQNGCQIAGRYRFQEKMGEG
jgi:hypothetical protein